MALGATKTDILRLVIANGLLLTAAGILIGLAGSIALTRLMAAVLYQTSATDPLTLAAVVAVLLGVAVVASVVPATRAARVDPMVALREE